MRVKPCKTSTFDYWKVGTVNVQTASNDLHLAEYIRLCTLPIIDICALQETRRLGQNCIDIPIKIDNSTINWTVYWSGDKSIRQGGVAIAFKTNKILEN